MQTACPSDAPLTLTLHSLFTGRRRRCPPFLTPCLRAGYIAATIANVTELSFYAVGMYRQGYVDLIAGSSFCAAFLMLLINVLHCKTTAFNEDQVELSSDQDISEISIVGVTYLRCRGMEVFSAAQDKLAADQGRKVEPGSSLMTLRNAAVRASLVESLTLHFLPGFLPTALAASVSCFRNVQVMRAKPAKRCYAKRAVWQDRPD